MIMCVDLRRHCRDLNKLLVLGLVRLLNILIFVVLSFHVLIRAYLLRKQQLNAPYSYFMLMTLLLLVMILLKLVVSKMPCMFVLK